MSPSSSVVLALVLLGALAGAPARAGRVRLNAPAGAELDHLGGTVPVDSGLVPPGSPRDSDPVPSAGAADLVEVPMGGDPGVLLPAAARQDPAPTDEPPPTLTHGPILGEVTATSAWIWARGSAEASYGLYVRDDRGGTWRPGRRATADEDLCMSFLVTDLDEDSHYDYTLQHEGRVLAQGSFHTPPRAQPRATLVFGSCADERRFPEHGVWKAIAGHEPDALVLLGDTPYIDSTDLAHQRRRYREFYAVEDLGALLATTSTHFTWDDHDFGANDTDGNLEGREASRQAFLEYHPGSDYGQHGEGIYSSFRRGPVEVFLIDARWFAGRETSVAAEGGRSLLGAAQWKWLTEGLKASTARFKVLASGMIWNGATRPGKPDHWGSYAPERDALFAFVGDHHISGVVLVGGDIHRSRVVVHATKKLAGYPLTELISSPMANTIIETANAPHPGLAWDAGLMHTYLLLDADTRDGQAVLTAHFLTADGTAHHTVTLTAADLTGPGEPVKSPR